MLIKGGNWKFIFYKVSFFQLEMNAYFLMGTNNCSAYPTYLSMFEISFKSIIIYKISKNIVCISAPYVTDKTLKNFVSPVLIM
jgi:hypothetical protein